MKISLVIPVHNLEKYIEPLLISLKYQNYDHDKIEPIFICDCCEDRTHEIIEETLKDSFKNLVILDRQYHSSGLGRNDGIERATGDYIWLLDGDDWLIDNHAILKVVNYFTQYPGDKVVHVGWLSNGFTNKAYLHTVWQWVFAAYWAKPVKFTSRKYDDDVEWVNKMMKTYKVDQVGDINDPLYFYNYMREGSVMHERLTGRKENGTNKN